MPRKLEMIIVDDEPLARITFIKIIEERFPSFQIIGEAGTGPEGLSLFRSKKPDIVIMDIEIPDLNGLETSQIILNESPFTQIIILTAYDNFDYAQNAINSGFLGYLLKPVQEKYLHKLLDKASFQIEWSNSLSREKKEYHIFRSLAMRDMVSSFIYGKRGGVSAKTYASLVSPPIQGGGFLLFLLENRLILKEEEINKIYDYLDNFPGCFSGYWQGPLLPVFVCKEIKEIGSRTIKWKDEVEIIAREIQRRIQVLTGNRLKVGGGQPQYSPELFSFSFRQAFDALKTGNNLEFILYSEDSKAGSRRISYPEKIEQKLIRALICSDWIQVKNDGREFSQWILYAEQSLVDSKFGIMELLIQIRRQEKFSGDFQLTDLIQTMLREVELPQDKSSQSQWFESAIEEIIHLLNHSGSIEDRYLDRVLKYIDLNDFNRISLENAAELIGLTPQYLSRIFKIRFKVKFIDYVIKRRVESACSLLRTSNLSIKEIAARSGYNDIGYFRKVFRKETNLTPRDYRYQNQ